jgi:hypothetical protein
MLAFLANIGRFRYVHQYIVHPIVRIEGKMNGEKYREMLDENLRQGAQDWGKGSHSNRTTTLSTQPRQRRSGYAGAALNVLEWPS